MPPGREAAPRDTTLLFTARFIRLFAYGALSVVLVFYLRAIGLSDARIGLLLTLTLLGDTLVSLAITTHADRIGRRRMLIAGALLMTGAGIVMAWSTMFWVLVVAATLGVISPSGQEVGPFLPIEQAALTGLVDDRARTSTYAWYALTGAFASALGALGGGFLAQAVRQGPAPTVASYRAVVVLYATLGVALAAVFLSLSRRVEVVPATAPGATFRLTSGLGSDRSRQVVRGLSA